MLGLTVIFIIWQSEDQDIQMAMVIIQNFITKGRKYNVRPLKQKRNRPIDGPVQ